MSCKSCKSDNQRHFSSEICVHFPGLEGLKEPAVLVFPKIVVCLDCGHAEFSMPETELRLLDDSAEGKKGPPSPA